jgi:cytochrome c oxidase subunit 4
MADHAHDHGHGDAAARHGPTTGTYIIVAVFLTVVTALEVGIYYVEAIRTSAAFVPVLLFLSAMKFFTVVGFYMHLKYDHKLFRRLFGGPFLIAISTMLALLFLFGQIAL